MERLFSLNIYLPSKLNFFGLDLSLSFKILNWHFSLPSSLCRGSEDLAFLFNSPFAGKWNFRLAKYFVWC